MNKVFLVIILVASMAGCCYDKPRSFDGDDEFEDYKPWWVTNRVTSVTNANILLIK